MSNTLAGKCEKDPNGLNPHQPGAKLDAGKVRPAMVLGGFARALLAVSRIGTSGAVKYTDNGWVEVPNGEARYDDAKLRHWLTEKTGVEFDPDSGEEHAVHEAWNALARLDLILRRKEQEAEKPPHTHTAMNAAFDAPGAIGSSRWFDQRGSGTRGKDCR